MSNMSIAATGHFEGELWKEIASSLYSSQLYLIMMTFHGPYVRQTDEQLDWEYVIRTDIRTPAPSCPQAISVQEPCP